MKESFFNQINYSSSNEDSESELRALQLHQKGITGSGARTLDLLTAAPEKIISIDFNPMQNFLLEVKMAAYRMLSYAEFKAFIGLVPSSNRLEILDLLQPLLSVPAQQFWKANRKLIEGGLLYCGTWEKFLRSMLKMMFFRKRTVHELMTSTSLQQQTNTWNQKWDNRTWRWFFKLISNRFLWTTVLKEPGAKLIPKEFDVAQYLKERINFLATHFDLKTNHYANLLFKGEYTETCLLPHHLREENFQIIKSNLDRIEIVQDSLANFLTGKTSAISAFSLSDFSSYAPLETYVHIWKAIVKAVTPQAKFCERQFLVKRNPDQLISEINRNPVLENALLMNDETAIYSFCAGTING